VRARPFRVGIAEGLMRVHADLIEREEYEDVFAFVKGRYGATLPLPIFAGSPTQYKEDTP